MRENLLIDKSIAFAARIIKLHKHLIKTQKETVISKQIVRSGTSIGANINEANYGQSKADFISKLHIALKEAAETEYWLRLLLASSYISEEMGESLLKDCLELKKILIASINTASESLAAFLNFPGCSEPRSGEESREQDAQCAPMISPISSGIWGASRAIRSVPASKISDFT